MGCFVTQANTKKKVSGFYYNTLVFKTLINTHINLKVNEEVKLATACEFCDTQAFFSFNKSLSADRRFIEFTKLQLCLHVLRFRTTPIHVQMRFLCKETQAWSGPIKLKTFPIVGSHPATFCAVSAQAFCIIIAQKESHLDCNKRFFQLVK